MFPCGDALSCSYISSVNVNVVRSLLGLRNARRIEALATALEFEVSIRSASGNGDNVSRRG